MPADRRGQGILRGCYGTGGTPHGNEAVAVGIPFRYWDRYKSLTADSQTVTYGAAKTALGARWLSLSTAVDSRDKNLRVVVQARFDGRPGWDSVPKGGPGGLYEFAGGGGSLNVPADQMEVRVLFGYGAGSYFPRDTWKRAPTLLKMAVEYEQPTRTLYHEER